MNQANILTDFCQRILFFLKWKKKERNQRNGRYFTLTQFNILFEISA